MSRKTVETSEKNNVKPENIRKLPKFIIQSELAQSEATTDLHKIDKTEDKKAVSFEISTNGRIHLPRKNDHPDFDKAMHLMTELKSTLSKESETAKLAQANQSPNSVFQLLK